MAKQARLLTDLAGLKSDYIKRMNALWLTTIEDVAGIIRLSEINPSVTPQMITSLLAHELNITQESVQSEFIKIIRDSIPDHEWYAIAKIDEPLQFGFLLDDFQRGSISSDLLTSSATPPLAPLPTRINLMETYPKYFATVRNQDQRGTCVAFAVTAFHEYIHGRIRNETSPRLSEEFLYWASRTVQYQDMPTTCHQCGTFIHTALKAIIELGQCSYETLPYQEFHRPCNIKLFDGDIEDNFNQCTHDNQDQKRSFIASGNIPQALASEAEKYRLNNWEIVELSTIYNVKQALYEGYPVLVGVKVYLSWYSPPTRHKGRISIPFLIEFNNSNYQLGGHAMLLVGYEDDPSDKNLATPGGGYFLLRNSWGKSWGDESANGLPPGYGMLPYAYLSQHPFRAYTLKPKAQDKTKV